jgi:alpha-glucosidase (family GH31 glycosyl hydrolase)
MSANTSAEIEILCLSDGVIAIDLTTDYTGSKPSFLVPRRNEPKAKAERSGSAFNIDSGGLRVVANEDRSEIKIFRSGQGADADPVCTILNAASDGADVILDRSYPFYGVGGNNAWVQRGHNDVDELTEHDIDRRGHVYTVHHRKTGQGNNFMPWILSAQGLGIFADCTYPMSLDLEGRVRFSGKNIRTLYFIDGPTPSEALSRFVALTGLPPMHPAWVLGFEQSTRSFMGWGELDFVTTYFREKNIPVDGLDLLTTYGGEGGTGTLGRDFHADYLDGYQGWHEVGSYKSYNKKLLPNGAADIKTLRDRGFRPIVHGYWMGDYEDADEMEALWQNYRHLLKDGWEGWWLDGVEYCDVGDPTVEDQSYKPKNPEKFTDEFRDEHDNVWALMRARAFYEKQRRDFPNKRVHILNRTAFPGQQAYAAGVNQGDYWSSWELMRTQTIYLLQMGMSGILFPESDIGGHFPTGELTDELFIRWAFMGLFSPLMR